MAVVDLATRTGRASGSARPSADSAARSPLTLADEHVLLLWQVTARAAELIAAIADGGRPDVELRALAGYAQAEVLRQLSDEEALLFPAMPAQQAAALARDHARLRAAADLLARADAGEQQLSAGQIAATARDLVTLLERHLQTEEKQLAAQRATPSTPATMTLSGHRHEWYSVTEGPAVDLDALPPGQAVAAAVDRLLRLRRGEQLELLSGADLEPVWREISRRNPYGYQFIAVQDGPPRWRMRVARRAADAD